MKTTSYLIGAFAVSTTCLSSCGGGGNSQIASAPAPVTPSPNLSPSPSPSPMASPTPIPSYEPQPASIFVKPLYAEALAVAGKGWQHEYVPNALGANNVRNADDFAVSYDATAAVYRVSAAGAGSGILYQISPGGADEPGGSFAAVLADSAAAATGVPGTVRVTPAGQAGSRYSYVSFAWLFADVPSTGTQRTIAYGAFGIAQPTRAGEVPTTGTARYSGDLLGHFAGDSGATWIEGTSRFDFDFARDTLAGELTVTMRCGMGCAYGDVLYSLTDTQFTKGATSFSGSLATTGTASVGSFTGLFAGPDAVEMMSSFELPFYNPEYQRWMSAAGVILGKRD